MIFIWLKNQIAGLFSAVNFLTVLPIKIKRVDTNASSFGSGWFPLVGLLIGGCTVLSSYFLQMIFPKTLCSAMTVAVWIGLTGALHLDGLADCCDGLFVSAPAGRRLEIMHDSRIGTFAAVGLMLYLMIKVLAVYELPESLFNSAILLSSTTARWSLLLVSSCPVKWSPDGMGSSFAADIRKRDIIISGLLPVLLAIWIGYQALIVLLAAFIVQAAAVVFAQKRLGLINGDVLGMALEISELAVLLAFILMF